MNDQMGWKHQLVQIEMSWWTRRQSDGLMWKLVIFFISYICIHLPFVNITVMIVWHDVTNGAILGTVSEGWNNHRRLCRSKVTRLHVILCPLVLIDDARSDVIVLLIIVIIFISLINTIHDHHDPHHDRVYISFNPKYWLVLFRLFMSLLSIFFQPFPVVSHVPHLRQMERRHPDLFQKSWDPRLTFLPSCFSMAGSYHFVSDMVF